MSLRVSGKNIEIGQALRERIEARVAETMDKYFDGGYSGHVTVEKEGFGFRTECAVHLDSRVSLQSEANDADAYTCAETAWVRMEKQLRRYKRWRQDRRTTGADDIR